MKHSTMIWILTVVVWSVGITSLPAQNAPVTTIPSVSACPGSNVSFAATTTGFTGITSMSLYVKYKPALMTYTSGSGNPLLDGFSISNAVDIGGGYHMRVVQFAKLFGGSVALPSGATLFTMNFNYISGVSPLAFHNEGGYDCEYTGGGFPPEPLFDEPASLYYINGGIPDPMPGTGNVSGPISVTPGTNGLVYSTTVISNASSYNWSVPSGFEIVSGNGTSSITVNATLAAQSGNVSVQGVNTCGSGAWASLAVSTGRVLNLTLFPEGLYNGIGLNKAQGSSGGQYPGDVADKITVQLHDAADYNTVLHTASSVDLNTSGLASLNLPSSLSGEYFISIHHRNSLVTVSAAPVSLSASVTSYNFTDNASKAYGNNQKASGSIYLLYGGDVNQDGVVDGLDLVETDNQAALFATGYIPADVNGDGTVNLSDTQMVTTNAQLFAKSLTP